MVKLYEPDYRTFDGMSVVELDEDAVRIIRERLSIRRGPGWVDYIYVCYGEPHRGKFFKLIEVFEGYGKGMPVAWRRKMRNKVARLLEL